MCQKLEFYQCEKCGAKFPTLELITEHHCIQERSYIMDINSIMVEVIKSASNAAEEQLKTLEAAGPRYTVHESDLFDLNVGPAIGTMLDDCGGAYLNLGGREKFVNQVKKEIPFDGQYYCGDGWSMHKGVYKGYTIFISHACRGRQEMSVHEAAMEAAKNKFAEYEVKVIVRSYID